MTKRSQSKSNFPTGPRTIVLKDLDEDTWFDLLATIGARIFQFEARLAQAKKFGDPPKVIEHYESTIKSHKQIEQMIREQVRNPIN